jgi:cell division protein ZapA (FtsZ GTPase activity inhibitor)
MTANITDRLDEIERLRAAATPGPWETTAWGGTDHDGEGWAEYGVRLDDRGPVILGYDEQAQADAALIVAAVNAVPELVAAVRAVLALADRWDQVAIAADNGWQRTVNRSHADRLRTALAPQPRPEETQR